MSEKSPATFDSRKGVGLHCAPLLSAFVAASVLGANPREFLVQSWTRESGLPANTVTAVTQTPEGYLWIGTFGGLARFDGVRFTTIDLRQCVGLEDSLITSLATDSRGTLWVGGGDGSLVQFNHDGVMRRMPPSHRTTDRPLRRTVEAADGALWLLNYEGVLNRLTGDAFQEVAVRPDFSALVADTGQRVWVAAGNELLWDDGGQLALAWSATNEPGFLPEAMTAARTGGCWVAGNAQLRRFEAGRPREVRHLPQFKASSVSAMVEDQKGSVWIATYGEGLVMCDKDGRCRSLNRAQGLPSDLVRCLFEDREGNLWAGSEGRGLIRIRRATFLSYGTEQGMSGETILCVKESQAGDVWIGTNGEGVYRIRNDEVKHYGQDEGLTNPFVWALHCSREGAVWAGTWGGGLFRLDGERFVNTRADYGELPVVLALHEDTQGTLWIGQRLANARQIVALQGGSRRGYDVPGNARGIDVRCIAETPDGSLWFATTEDGLLRRKNGRITDCGTDEGLPLGPVSALHVDDEGDLWVAVAGVGLVFWEGERFRAIEGTRGLLDDNLNQISDDGLGHLWCGLRSGIIRLAKQDLHRIARGEKQSLAWQRFSKSAGLPSNECSGSGVRTRAGRIWFPTANGVAVVDPRHVVADPASPTVVIEAITLAGKSGISHQPLYAFSRARRLDSSEHALRAEETPQLSLKIPPGIGQLEIAFTALGSVAAEHVQFRYQLTGLDETAVEAGTDRLVRYNHLPPGDYVFQVTARNEGNRWSRDGTTLAFKVLPHYWQSGWFRVLAIFVFASGIAVVAGFAVRRRQRQRIEHLERLHALERERTRIAQDIHDDLGANLTRIAWLGELAASDKTSPERIDVHTRRIADCARQTVRALDEIVWAVNPQNDSLQSLAQYLTHYTHECFAPTRVNCRLEIPSDLPSIRLPSEVRHNLFLVVKEALHNVLKHAAASQVRVGLSVVDATLNLLVEDDGCGFSTPPAASGRAGHGMENLRRRMEVMGGMFTCDSAPGRGTKLSFVLRLPDAAG